MRCSRPSPHPLNGPRPARARSGFTLLEVMLATSLLAVGAVSVMIVLATAAGYASQRQSQQRLTQVLGEARNDARTLVNQFRPGGDAKLPGGQGGKTEPKQSALYPGYTYALAFTDVDAAVPEAGYQVLVTVTYGDGLEETESLIVSGDTIADDEFRTSRTYAEERAGEADRKGGREAR